MRLFSILSVAAFSLFIGFSRPAFAEMNNVDGLYTASDTSSSGDLSGIAFSLHENGFLTFASYTIYDHEDHVNGLCLYNYDSDTHSENLIVCHTPLHDSSDSTNTRFYSNFDTRVFSGRNYFIGVECNHSFEDCTVPWTDSFSGSLGSASFIESLNNDNASASAYAITSFEVEKSITQQSLNLHNSVIQTGLLISGVAIFLKVAHMVTSLA